MRENGLARAGTFCPNPDCPDYGKVNHGNLINYGQNRAGTPRRYCKTCKKAFAITKGTLFYRRRTPRKDILESLAMLADRMSLSGVARVKEETVLDWLRAAADHAEEVEEVLLRDYRLTRAQIDALWTYVGHKGEKGAPRRGRPWYLLAGDRDRHRYPPARRMGHRER